MKEICLEEKILDRNAIYVFGGKGIKVMFVGEWWDYKNKVFLYYMNTYESY